MELKIGNLYIRDKGFNNSGVVELVKSYGLFSRVRDIDTNGE